MATPLQEKCQDFQQKGLRECVKQEVFYVQYRAVSEAVKEIHHRLMRRVLMRCLFILWVCF